MKLQQCSRWIYYDEVECVSVVQLFNCRQNLGWTFHGRRYCQMNREPNKVKWFEFVVKCLAENEILLMSSGPMKLLNQCRWSANCRHCFWKHNEKPRLTPRPKHPIMVHVWAGISKWGAYIFEGKMDAPFYIEILRHYLVPFVQSKLISLNPSTNAR